MVCVEFSGAVYTLTEDQAKLLAENLRNHAKGTFPDAVEAGRRAQRQPQLADGALAAADFIEEVLVGNLDGPLPLEGKARNDLLDRSGSSRGWVDP